ncbi:MAG: peroxiredoxin [Gammaproteobacteria bacterium]|nr:peroxiredoxin [Gammaproteobacteria bacterium]
MTIAIGDSAPSITLPATGEQEINIAQLGGQALVLYFYPKDSTSGCTTEGQNFRDHIAAFSQHNCLILGVSRDGIRSHENFKAKQAFPFDLLSDREETLCKAFDVIKEKKLYGKVSMGIERSTFLFDGSGKLVKAWRKVKVKGHVDEVLAAVEAL